jgi:hypothetical protein
MSSPVTGWCCLNNSWYEKEQTRYFSYPESFKLNTNMNIVPHVTVWVGIAQWCSAGLRARCRGVRIPAEAGNFLFTTASKPALRPTQPPIQWVPWAFSLGVKRPERETDHSPPSIAKVKNGVVLSWSTGTTLPLPCHCWYSFVRNANHLNYLHSHCASKKAACRIIWRWTIWLYRSNQGGCGGWAM